jgi:hypothetical protein
MTFDEVTSILVLVVTAVLLGWRYRPRAFFGRLWATTTHLVRLFLYERPGDLIMSPFLGPAGEIEPMPTEQRSHAVEQPREPSGTAVGNDGPDLVEQLEHLDDDALLDILAQLRGADGEYRYAESRVAKFIGGRVEDRLTQVRDVRGTEKPAPAGRLLKVRDRAGERVISFRG